jgi:hypothetical protein
MGCTQESIKSIPFYSESCPIKITSSQDSSLKLLQVKFSNQSRDMVIFELQKLKDKLPYKLSVQIKGEGYRLFVGPIKQQDVSYIKDQLYLLGYVDTLLKSAPKLELLSTNKGLVMNNTNLGSVEAVVYHMPVNSSKKPDSLSYQEALDSCKSLGDNSNILKLPEYLNILLSENMSDFETKYWLTSTETVSNYNYKIETHLVNDTSKYSVICAIRN